METNDTIQGQVFNGKFGSYAPNPDFVAPSELTVTITLHEYRELVKGSAEREKLVAELQRLRNEVRDLLASTQKTDNGDK